MKKSIQFIALVLVVLSSAIIASANPLSIVAATGDKTVVTQVRPISSFHVIKVSGGIDVELSQGNGQKVEVVADENVISQIRTEVKDGVLNIFTEGSIRNAQTMEVHLTFQQLDAIIASGGCDIESEQKLNFTTLKLDISGGCDVELKCKADNLVCTLSGGCDVDLRGEAQKGSFNATGGCDLKASEFYLKNCTVDASGGSEVSVNATGELIISATGASEVNYYGKPVKVTKSAHGSSDINAR